MHYTGKMFQIIKDNKFNLKEANKQVCETGSTIWYGKSSYIETVKWEDFKTNYDKYIDGAYERQNDLEDYDIEKNIKE